MISTEIQQVEKYYTMISEYLVKYSMQLVGALLILIFGLWVAQKISKMIAALMARNNIDITLTNFVSNVVKVLFIVMWYGI